MSLSRSGSVPTAEVPWEEVPVCGACGVSSFELAGTIGRRRFVTCQGCRIERLFDRIAENRLDLLYATYYDPEPLQPSALEQQLANPTFLHRRLRLERALGGRAQRLLEVGCGDGNFLATLRRAGWEAHGQEYSARTAALVERRHGIPVTSGPLESLRTERPFPVVAAYHVFEHIYHPAAWLQSVHRLIEPNGLLHLQVPNGGSLTRRLSGGLWSSLVFPQHVYFYQPLTLAALLARLGYTVLSATTWDPWHGPGAVSATATNAVNRIVTGRRPWSEDAITRCGTSGEPSAAPLGRSAIRAALRGGLGAASLVLARLEAAIGRGAVVDVVARSGH